MRRLLSVLPLLTFSLPAMAQERAIPPAVMAFFRSAVGLQRPLEIDGPTILILVDMSEPDDPTSRATEADLLGDSLRTALSGTGATWGYGVEVRATTHMGLYDPASNSRYTAAPVRGPGILLLLPNRRPSRLLPYLTPEQLTAELSSYEQLFRLLQPL